MTAVVALSAERGAGKTTLATTAAATLHATHAIVSRWLAYRLIEAGGEPSADALRVAGERAAADPRGLVAEVLGYSGWRPGQALVFDAVRHGEVLEALREHVAPQRVVHVALVLEPVLLARRLASRGDADDVVAGASHSTEAQVPLLVAIADLVLDAALPVDALVQQLVERLRRDC